MSGGGGSGGEGSAPASISREDVFRLSLTDWSCDPQPLSAPVPVKGEALLAAAVAYGPCPFRFVPLSGVVSYSNHQILASVEQKVGKVTGNIYRWVFGAKNRPEGEERVKFISNTSIRPKFFQHSFVSFLRIAHRNPYLYQHPSIQNIVKYLKDISNLPVIFPPREEFEFINIYGSAVTTPWHIVVTEKDDHGGPVKRPEDVLNCYFHACAFTTVDGDGTVPSVSAAHDGLRCDAKFEIRGAEHVDILKDHRFLNILASLLALPALPYPSEAQRALAEYQARFPAK